MTTPTTQTPTPSTDQVLDRLIEMRLILRDESGKRVHPLNPTAVCWCLTGVAWKVAGADDRLYAAILRVLRQSGAERRDVVESTDYLAVAGWQDHRAHADVLAVLNRAVRSAHGRAA